MNPYLFFRRSGILLLALLVSPAGVQALLDDDGRDFWEDEHQLDPLPVDERVLELEWADVPFNQDAFDYTIEEMEELWPEIMRGIQAPYPDADYVEYMVTSYPEAMEGVDAFEEGEYEAYSRAVLEIWRLFMRGDFREARDQGRGLGPLGMMPAYLSQIMHAIYLAERQTDKYQLLQDVANQVGDYFELIHDMKDDPDPRARETAALVLLGHAYAIARIAEEAPIAVAIHRGYIALVKDAAEEIVSIMPDHPLANAFLAGVDAGIMRRVGRGTGRLTYGTRITTVNQAFEKAFAGAPDVPVLKYEYANALLYMSRRRELDQALRLLESTTRFRPIFSMDALDTMYAFKRLQEVRLFNDEYDSFRRFERDRRSFTEITDRNLTNVLTPVLNLDMLENPEDYKLPDRGW